MKSVTSLQEFGVRSIAVAVLIASLFSVWACDENQILSTLPGEGWSLVADSITSITATSVKKARSVGGSATLHAGLIIEPIEREAGILLRFAAVDSIHLANFESAQLRIFRRTFPASPELLDSVFTLEKINTGPGDTLWVENDTGLTLMNFADTDSISSASLIDDTVNVLQSGTSIVRQSAEHLAFDIDSTLLLAWRENPMTSYGFLIRAPEGSGLVSYYSRESIWPPYLAINHYDTTAGSTDIKTDYYIPVHDASAYPPLAGPAPSDAQLVLNRSDGYQGYIDFSEQFDSLGARPIASGRLILTVVEDATHMMSSLMVMDIFLRIQPVSQGDSGIFDYDDIAFSAAGNTLVYNLGPLLMDYVSERYENHGFDIVVGGSQNDFDRLTLWGPDALDPADQPRLEIVYALPPGMSE